MFLFVRGKSGDMEGDRMPVSGQWCAGEVLVEELGASGIKRIIVKF